MASKKKNAYGRREVTLLIVMALLFAAPFGLIWWSARGDTIGTTAFSTGADWDAEDNETGVRFSMGTPIYEEADTSLSGSNVSIEYTNAELYHYFELTIKWNDLNGTVLKENEFTGMQVDLDFYNYGIVLEDVVYAQVRRGDYPNYYEADEKYKMTVASDNATAENITLTYDFTSIDRVNWPDDENISVYIELSSAGAQKLSVYGGPITMTYSLFSDPASYTGLDRSTILGIELVSVGLIGFVAAGTATERVKWEMIAQRIGLAFGGR